MALSTLLIALLVSGVLYGVFDDFYAPLILLSAGVMAVLLIGTLKEQAAERDQAYRDATEQIGEYNFDVDIERDLVKWRELDRICEAGYAVNHHPELSSNPPVYEFHEVLCYLLVDQDELESGD